MKFTIRTKDTRRAATNRSFGIHTVFKLSDNKRLGIQFQDTVKLHTQLHHKNITHSSHKPKRKKSEYSASILDTSHGTTTPCWHTRVMPHNSEGSSHPMHVPQVMKGYPSTPTRNGTLTAICPQHIFQIFALTPAIHPDSLPFKADHPNPVAQKNTLSPSIMDEQEFSDECEKRRRSLMAYAYTCCHSVHLAEDIVQDALLIAFTKRDSYQADSDFGAWLIAITRNVWFKERDKRRIRDKHTPFIQKHATQIFNNANFNDNKWEEEETALENCLQKLSDIDQDLISCHFQHGEKYQDMASKLGKTLSWVKVRMHRSRKALLECVQRSVDLAQKEDKHVS